MEREYEIDSVDEKKDDLEDTKEFEIKEELEKKLAEDEEVEEKKKDVMKKLIKKPNNTKKILLVVLIALVVILASGAVYYFLFREKNIEYSEYTLKMVTNTFSFNGLGVIVTDDIAKYNIDEADSIEFLVGSYPAKGDIVDIGDILFKYKETSLGDSLYKGVKPVTAGVVHSLTAESVTVRESISANIDVPAAIYSPAVGTCAIMVIDASGNAKTVNGEVSQVLHGVAVDYVTLTLISPQYDLGDGDTGEIKFANDALSTVYECSDLYVTEDGKISDIGNHGASEPAYEASNVEISAVTSIYTDDFPESEDPGDDYVLAKEDGIQIAIGQNVTTSTYLFRWTFLEKSIENKTIKSLVRGEVKSVSLVKDDPVVNTGTYEIEIYDLDKNYLVFDIASEYEDYISVDTTALIVEAQIDIAKIEITAEVTSVEDLVGSVANANFKNYDINDEFSVTIEGTGDDVLLIPKEYIKEGMVKKVIGEEIKELEVTYEEYNEDNYKITEGLDEGDIVESYE